MAQAQPYGLTVNPAVNPCEDPVSYMLYVNVKEARGLATGSSHLVHCEVMLRRGVETFLQEHKTRQLKEVPPKWNATVSLSARVDDVVVVSCFDSDAFGKTLLGRAEVSVSSLEMGKPNDRWFHLLRTRCRSHGQGYR
eukprot:RCo031244